MNFKIVSTCDLSGVPEAVSILEEVGQVNCLGNDRDQVLPALAECDAYMAGGSILVDQEFLNAAPYLKVVGSPHTGKTHLDLEVLEQRGITVFHIADEIELLNEFTATSELAFGLLLCLIRKIPSGLKSVKSGNWLWEKFVGFQLYGKTLGILGLGRLGRITAQIGQGFGMTVIAHDIRKVSAENVEVVDLDTLLLRADVLSIHVHLTPNTEQMLDADFFRRMKKGAILINTSRGRVIEEAALIKNLLSGHLAGAALDVIDGEWLQSAELLDHPLIVYAREHNNLLISPHIGGSTVESIYGARMFMARKMANYLSGLF